MKLKNEILIVGQGLAGTVLCSYLLRNNIPFRVIDNSHHAAATHAAAGLINPITGRGYVKSWRIESLLEEARNCYQYFEDLLDASFMRERVILRSLKTPQHINKWNSSTARPGYSEFLEDERQVTDYDAHIEKPIKYGIIRNAFQVDIARLINLFSEWLDDHALLTREKFDYSKLEHKQDCCIYKSVKYDLVIFCEGFQAIYNPWFSYLPFQPAKGEALEISISGLNTKQVLRDDIFIAPLKDGLYWSGGSYIWEFKDHMPTDSWKENWMEKLDALLKTGYEIKNHKAGIRPSVKGRRPLIGFHNTLNRYYIFNGLGTKGTSLAPYHARHLVESHLSHGEAIDPEVDICRFAH